MSKKLYRKKGQKNRWEKAAKRGRNGVETVIKKRAKKGNKKYKKKSRKNPQQKPTKKGYEKYKKCPPNKWGKNIKRNEKRTDRRQRGRNWRPIFSFSSYAPPLGLTTNEKFITIEIGAGIGGA